MGKFTIKSDKWADLNKLSEEAADIWLEYAAVFEERWGLEKTQSWGIGLLGDMIFEREVQEHGDFAYEDSIVLPIRNAWFVAQFACNRKSVFDKHTPLKEPILDYGAGVGFTLRLLQEWYGHEELYYHELPGVQRKVATGYLAGHGIHTWNGKKKMGTVVCINVLEHVERPLHLLDQLRTIGDKVVANISMGDKEQHIAPQEDMLEVYESLKANGELLE